MGPARITLMSNAGGSWAVLGRFDDSPQLRADLDASCSTLHYHTDRRTHFKIVDEQGNTLATLRDGATQFEAVKGRG